MSYVQIGLLILCAGAWYKTYELNQLMWHRTPNQSAQERRSARRNHLFNLLSQIFFVVFMFVLITGVSTGTAVFISILYGFYCIGMLMVNSKLSRPQTTYSPRK